MSENYHVKARKPHRCALCGFMIEAGEKYYRRRLGPMDHSENEGFFALKAHLDCWSLWLKIGDGQDWILSDPADFIQGLTDAGLIEPCSLCGERWCRCARPIPRAAAT